MARIAKSVKILIPVAIIVIFALSLSSAFTKPSDEEISAVFSSAESLFKAMKERNYVAVWQGLTEKTKKKTIEAVYKSSRKAKIETDRERIGVDFEKGGTLAKAYWDSYLNAFDPDQVLEQSKWDIGFIKKDTAEITVLYKKSANPANIQLSRENDVWKVGLEETFGARNLLPF